MNYGSINILKLKLIEKTEFINYLYCIFTPKLLVIILKYYSLFDYLICNAFVELRLVKEWHLFSNVVQFLIINFMLYVCIWKLERLELYFMVFTNHL